MKVQIYDIAIAGTELIKKDNRNGGIVNIVNRIKPYVKEQDTHRKVDVLNG